MVYGAPWGRLLVGVSAAATLVIVMVAGVLAVKIEHPPGMGLGLAGLSLLIPAGALLFVIRSYRLDGPNLYVQRLLWETEVDLRELESVGTDSHALRGSIRLFGNGGLFSFSGLYRSRRLGRYRAYVTEWKNAVVLRSRTTCAVVSPDDPEGFVADVLDRHPRAVRPRKEER